uniref:Chromo domain-containing protein n=1 Tax=Rhabditophanes sp. KR3021 TaxID=114890 RepID=A0AC35UHZ6_9BILA
MSTAFKAVDKSSKIKKTLLVEWRHEEEISESEAKKILQHYAAPDDTSITHNEYKPDFYLPKKRNSNLSLKKPHHDKRCVTQKRSLCSTQEIDHTSQRKSAPKRSGKRENGSCNSKVTNGITTVTSETTIGGQIMIPYKLYWKPLKSSNGKEGLTFKIQVHDLNGNVMELDANCPEFRPRSVRLNGANLPRV